MSTEHSMSSRSKGGYEVWAKNIAISASWQTIQGAQASLNGLKRAFGEPLEIFYVHKIPTAEEKETFHVTQTGRDPAREPFLRDKNPSEGRTQRLREGLDSNAGTGSQTVARLREALARSTEDNTRLRAYVRELEEELGREQR